MVRTSKALLNRKSLWCPVAEIACLSSGGRQGSWLIFKAVRAGLAVLSSILHQFRTPTDLCPCRNCETGAGRKERVRRPPDGKSSQPAAARRITMKMGWPRRCSSVAYRFRYAPLLAPCRRPVLISTKGMLFRRQDTSTPGSYTLRIFG